MRTSLLAHENRGTKMRKLVILTFNAGLLSINMFGYPLIVPTDYIEERLQYIPAALIAMNADVIALQEVYTKPHQDYLIAHLSEIYPHYVSKRNRSIGLPNGLMFFSKYPIVEWEYYQFDDAGPFDEKLIANKGTLTITVSLDDLGNLTLYNVHPTSGGMLNGQDDPDIETKRQNQIDEVLQLTKRTNKGMSVVLGDFNAGPQISNRNYESLFAHGFVDVYKRVCESRGECEKITWDAQNPLNISGTHSTSPSQRIDHIYVQESVLDSLEISDARIIFEEAIVPLPTETVEEGAEIPKVPLSDHYGLIVELQRKLQ